MNAYGRYVHIFFGILLMLPILILATQVESLILALFSTIALICATCGMALIVRGVAAPPLVTPPSPAEKRKDSVQPS